MDINVSIANGLNTLYMAGVTRSLATPETKTLCKCQKNIQKKSHVGMDNFRVVRHFTAAGFRSWKAGKGLERYGSTGRTQPPSCPCSAGRAFRTFPPYPAMMPDILH